MDKQKQASCRGGGVNQEREGGEGGARVSLVGAEPCCQTAVSGRLMMPVKTSYDVACLSREWSVRWHPHCGGPELFSTRVCQQGGTHYQQHCLLSKSDFEEPPRPVEHNTSFNSDRWPRGTQ